MEAIIIGVPGRGKTTLCGKLQEENKMLRVCNLGSLRNSLGLHTPHKGFDLEVDPNDLECYYKVLRTLLHYNRLDYVMEGYGLGPRKARKMAQQYNLPLVLLAHKTTTVEEDVALLRKYDAPDKWTHFRTDDYLYELFKFYKEVEQKWIKQMPSEMVFYTDTDFEENIEKAHQYIIDEYVRLKAE